MLQPKKLLAAMALTASFPAWSNDYTLVYSETNDRAGSIPLDGATVSGDLFGRVEPDTGDIDEVRFYLDGASRLFHDEGTAPYELQGGRATARPWDTEDLDDGSHSIRTEVELDDGRVFSFDTQFIIANAAPPTGNVAPQLSSIPDQRMTAGQSRTILVQASDANGDALDISAGSLPSFVSFSVLGNGRAQLVAQPDETHIGRYTIAVLVSDGELSDDLSFELTVAEDLGSNFQLLYSETDDRAGSIPLSGAAVDGDLFARLHPEEGPAGEGIEEVRFYLDGAGSPFHDEGTAPYELQGGRNATRPWDTEKLDDGQHVIRTEVELDSGQVIAFETDFVIANDVPPPPPGPEAPELQAMGDQLLRVGESRELSVRATDANGDDISLAVNGPAFVTFVDQGDGRGTLTLAPQAEDLGSHSLTITASDAALSSSLQIKIDVQEVPENEFQLVFSERSDRVGATPLHGATVDGDLFARVQPELGPEGQGIEEVRFYLDGAGSHFHDEGSAPYELAGGRATTRPWDTEDLDDGSHAIRTEVELDDGQVISFDTVFTIANDAPPPPPPPSLPGDRQLPTAAGEEELLRYPYAQQPSADELSILWATATGGNAQLNLRDGDGKLLREVAAETDQLTSGHTGMSDDLFLHRARLDGLPADSEFLYEVSHDGVLMAQGLPLKTMPALDAAVVEFLAFGDMGVDDDDARRVRDAMASRNPDGSYVYPRDFIVGLGDLAYTAGTHSEFDKNFFDQMSGKGSEADEHAPDNGILLDRPFMTVLGNHEYDNDPATRPDGVLDSFAAPVMDGIPADDRERYYSFDVGPVHFLVLDTSKFEVESSVSRYDEMMAWADADLAASDQPWKVVFFHHSPFSYGKHGTYADISENRRMREEMVPVLQRHSVRAAFFGHDHMYSRTQPLKVVESGEDIGRIQRHEDDSIDHDGGIVFVGNGNGGKGLHNRTTNITTAGSNSWRDQRSRWGIGYDFVAWRNGEPVLFDDPDIGADDPLFPQWRKGFSHVRISAEGIAVTSYNSDGDVLDSFVIAP